MDGMDGMVLNVGGTFTALAYTFTNNTTRRGDRVCWSGNSQCDGASAIGWGRGGTFGPQATAVMAAPALPAAAAARATGSAPDSGGQRRCWRSCQCFRCTGP